LSPKPLQTLAVKGTKPFGSLALFDERNVVAALAIADPRVMTERAASALFATAARGRQKPLAIPRELLDTEDYDLSPYVESYLSYFDTKDWKAGQDWVRTWVPVIARFDTLSKAKRADVHRAINDTAESFGFAMQIQVSEEGIKVASEKDSISNACVRAFIPFVIPNGWSPRRLAQCQFDDCGQWFLRPEITKGKVRQFCSEKHASVARVRAFRERQHKEMRA